MLKNANVTGKESGSTFKMNGKKSVVAIIWKTILILMVLTIKI